MLRQLRFDSQPLQLARSWSWSPVSRTTISHEHPTKAYIFELVKNQQFDIVEGDTFLTVTNTNFESETSVQYSSITLNKILTYMERAQNKTNIINIGSIDRNFLC